MAVGLHGVVVQHLVLKLEVVIVLHQIHAELLVQATLHNLVLAEVVFLLAYLTVLENNAAVMVVLEAAEHAALVKLVQVITNVFQLAQLVVLRVQQ